MRYLIFKKYITNEEITSRMKYIYDIFHVYTFVDNKNSNRDMIVLNSIPRKELDILFIIGHDEKVNSYVVNNIDTIYEKNIIAVTCNTKKIKKMSSSNGKKIYLPNNENIINCFCGKNKGFDFDITDEEVMLYRNKNINFKKMLSNTFKIWEK